MSASNKFIYYTMNILLQSWDNPTFVTFSSVEFQYIFYTLHSTTFVNIEPKVHLKREFDTYDVIMTSQYVEQICFDVRETNLIFFIGLDVI